MLHLAIYCMSHSKSLLLTARYTININWCLNEQVCMATVIGDYTVEVRTHNYSNPGSLLARNGACCDPLHMSCLNFTGCDNYFYYCLRSLGSNGTDCTGGRTSLINYDDAPLNFSQDTVLGLPNPLPLPGLTKEWHVS